MAVKKVKRRTRVSPQTSAQQTPRKKGQQSHEASSNPKSKKAVIIAQEIKFARLLASNDKRIRDKVIKNLKKWLTVRSKSSFAFTEADFLRLWKGLFYCMWMSDKPLIQEELAESLSKIVHCFDANDVALLYTKCALQTLATEWFGIDQYRLDKFAMLVRRIIRQTFILCKNKSWEIEWMKEVSELLEKLLLHPKTCLGFSMHLTELLFEELSKVSCGDIPEDVVTHIVRPFAAYLTPMDDERQIRHVMKHIFRYLIFQSDVGIEYIEKFEAWRRAGFPGGSIDAMQKIEASDEEEDENMNESNEEEPSQNQTKHNVEKPLDPRAGRVDVELSQIPFNPKQIVELLTQYKFHPSSTTKSRRQILHLIKEFTELSEGNMPLGVKEVRLPNKRKGDTDTKRAASRLLRLQEELHSDNVHKKKRKRKSNGQLVDEERESDESTDDTASDDDIGEEMELDDETFEPEENEIDGDTRKEERVKNKKSSVTQSKECETNAIVSPSKRKRTKLQRKDKPNNHTAERNKHETDVENDNLKTSSPNDKPRKLKPKQNGEIASPVKLITPVKKKKLGKVKVCGSWDVSENVDPPTPTSVAEDDAETSNTSATSPPSKNDNVTLDKRATWLAPIVRKLEDGRSKTPASAKKQATLTPESGAKKRVKIVLQRNTAQHTSEYIQQIRLSPAIPFDANKKPLAGVLKASPMSSPINPFYRKNMK